MAVFFLLPALATPVGSTLGRMDNEVDTYSQIQEWIVRVLSIGCWNLTPQHLIRKLAEY